MGNIIKIHRTQTNFPIWHLTNTSFRTSFCFSAFGFAHLCSFSFLYVFIYDALRQFPFPPIHSSFLSLHLFSCCSFWKVGQSCCHFYFVLFCSVLSQFQSNKKVRNGWKYGCEFIRFHSASLVCLVGFLFVCLLMNGVVVASVCCCFFRLVRGVFKWMTLL